VTKETGGFSYYLRQSTEGRRKITLHSRFHEELREKRERSF
jgi:hypothetical protein